MSNRLKLPLALIVASMLLGGCVPPPDGVPPLATLSLANTASIT